MVTWCGGLCQGSQLTTPVKSATLYVAECSTIACLSWLIAQVMTTSLFLHLLRMLAMRMPWWCDVWGRWSRLLRPEVQAGPCMSSSLEDSYTSATGLYVQLAPVPLGAVSQWLALYMSHVVLRVGVCGIVTGADKPACCMSTEEQPQRERDGPGYVCQFEGLLGHPPGKLARSRASLPRRLSSSCCVASMCTACVVCCFKTVQSMCCVLFEQ